MTKYYVLTYKVFVQFRYTLYVYICLIYIVNVYIYGIYTAEVLVYVNVLWSLVINPWGGTRLGDPKSPAAGFGERPLEIWKDHGGRRSDTLVRSERWNLEKKSFVFLWRGNLEKKSFVVFWGEWGWVLFIYIYYMPLFFLNLIRLVLGSMPFRPMKWESDS